jgi:nitroreductase
MDGPSLRTTRPADSRPGFETLVLDRRRFLVMLGGIAALAALPPALAEAARRAPRSDMPWSLPEGLPAGSIESAQALVGAAILAPSYWNAQPWRFEVDPAEMRLTLDPVRTLPACDPDQRFTQMSLGAALENLIVAARAWSLQPTVQYLPWGRPTRPGAPLVAARVTFAAAEQPRDRAQFQALSVRRTNPRHYEGRGITMPDRAALLAQVPDELNLHWLDDKDGIRKVASIVHDATLSRTHDRAAQAERWKWLRLSDDEAARSGDGVTPDRLSLSGPLGWLAARTLRPGAHGFTWGTGSVAHEAADAVRNSGALALLCAPKAEDATFLMAGQAYERLALKATALGLAQQPLSAPIESEAHRAALAKRFGAAGEEPLLLVRLGHARPPDPTPRRAVALVSTYRNS